MRGIMMLSNDQRQAEACQFQLKQFIAYLSHEGWASWRRRKPVAIFFAFVKKIKRRNQ
jgi:hypothetical protein